MLNEENWSGANIRSVVYTLASNQALRKELDHTQVKSPSESYS